MPGPLTELGQALALGAHDYATTRREEQQHARDRQEMLADEARRHDIALGDEKARLLDTRTYDKSQLDDARDYEAQIYKHRRFDALKNDLVKEGLLKPSDINSADAVQAALAKTSVDYQRNAEELASYKAMLPKLIEAVGTIPGADQVMSLKPDQVDQARAIVQAAYAKLGKKVDDDTLHGDLNKQTAAALIAVELENMRKTQADLADIEAGNVPPVERQQAFREAAAKMGYASEAKIPSDQRGAVQAAADKLIKDDRLVRGYQLQQTLVQAQRRFDNIADNARAGIYGYLKQAGATPPPAVTKPVTTAVTPGDEAAALRALQGGTAAAGPAAGRAPAPAAPTPTAAAPAALGVSGVTRRAPDMPPADYGRPFSDAVQADPGRGLGDVALGAGRDLAYNAMVGLQRAGDRVISRLPRPPSALGDVPSYSDNQVLVQIQGLQKQLQAVPQISPQADQIRAQLRSLQSQLPRQPVSPLGD